MTSTPAGIATQTVCMSSMYMNARGYRCKNAPPSIDPDTRLIIICIRMCVSLIIEGIHPPNIEAATINTQ